MESKNLLDVEKEINKQIEYINFNNEAVKSIEINKFTFKYLKDSGIYRFKDITTIINNNLNNYEIKFNTKKNSESTEYVPYKVLEERN